MNNKTIKILFYSAEILAIAYISILVYWIIVTPDYNAISTKVVTLINPFTTGSYIIGAIVVLNFFLTENKALKWLGLFIYITILTFSLISVMGITSVSGLVIFVPHIVYFSIRVGRFLYMIYHYDPLSQSKNE